jgi:hypothetical protein
MPVAFLSQFVYTAEAPAYLLDAFEDLVEGPETQGSLADVSSPPLLLLLPLLLPVLLQCWFRCCCSAGQ